MYQWGHEVLYPYVYRRQPSAAEEVLLSALRDSRRTVLTLQRMQKDVRSSKLCPPRLHPFA